MATVSSATIFIAVLSCAGVAAAQAPRNDRTVPAPDIRFRNAAGLHQAGVRCAAPEVNRGRGRAPRLDANTGAAAATGEIATAESASVSIPVAFHVVYTSKRGQKIGDVADDDLQAQIDVLNLAYAGTGFSFYLASVDRTQNGKWFTGCYNWSTEGQMKQALAIDPATTLNIYTCEPTQGILGYAYYPWSFSEDSYWHGAVLLYSSLPGGGAFPYDEGDTASHEVGHYLGLYHTFENGCAAPGDEVADTPAESSPAYGCPVGRDTCPAAGVDPIENFMDYTEDACMYQFSADQAARMQTAAALYRPTLGGPPPACGDVQCDAGEDECTCAADCGAPPASEINCSDGIDNDCDDAVDCADSSCAGSPACPTCSPAGAACSSNSQCCSNRCKGKPGSQVCN